MPGHPDPLSRLLRAGSRAYLAPAGCRGTSAWEIGTETLAVRAGELMAKSAGQRALTPVACLCPPCLSEAAIALVSIGTMPAGFAIRQWSDPGARHCHVQAQALPLSLQCCGTTADYRSNLQRSREGKKEVSDTLHYQTPRPTCSPILLPTQYQRSSQDG